MNNVKTELLRSPAANAFEPLSGCCHGCCSFTLTMSIGSGMRLCWLHALKMGLDVTAQDLGQ